MKDVNKQAKLRNMSISAMAIVIFGGFFLWILLKPDRIETLQNDVASGDTTPGQTTITRIDGVPAEDVWLESAESRLQRLETRSDQVEEENKRLREANEELQARQQTLIDDARDTIDRQAALIEEMAQQEQISIDQNLPTDDPFSFVSDAPINQTSPADSSAFESHAATNANAFAAQTLISFELADRPLKHGYSDAKFFGFDPQYWLPAGSFAPAVITAGAAAAVSVTGQGDPRPVIMRITGKARSASNDKGQPTEIDITGCTITGEARGDLSSERVYVRLQIMTCQTENGRITETQVRGFVAGAGQAGVRGPVITREGDLIQKSFIAGLVGGFGDTAARGLNPPRLVINGEEDDRRSNSAILSDAARAGVASGIGSAGDRLADYYINRAEQYQPVVSLRAGTNIDVIFLTGADISGKPVDTGVQ